MCFCVCINQSIAGGSLNSVLFFSIHCTHTHLDAQQGKEGGPLPEVKVDVEQPVQGSAPSPVSHPFPATDKCKLFCMCVCIM